MDMIPTTSDMEKHLTSIEMFGYSPNRSQDLETNAQTFLEDSSQKDFDDSEIYKEIKENEDFYEYENKTLSKKDKIIVEKISKKVMQRGKKTKDDLFEF